MNVRLESMCQGDGKIYAQIAIERLSADSIVTLEAHLKDGTEIPAHLLPFDPLDGQSAANFVIIVPHFVEREIMLRNSTNTAVPMRRWGVRILRSRRICSRGARASIRW